MKAVILAAGEGTRIKKYTEAMPKGMLPFAGNTLIGRQIENFKKSGISSIIIVTGFKPETIRYEEPTYYHNERYRTTNMLESLFCAEGEFDDDLIVSYADIIYESRLLAGLLEAQEDISVTVDIDWKEYWNIRYGDYRTDTESLSFNGDGTIKEIGMSEPDINAIDGRYVGLIKFSRKGIALCREIYHHNKEQYRDKPWQISGKPFMQAYMTDMIQALIDAGIPVGPYIVRGGWLEFDTNEDYEIMTQMYETGALAKLIDLTA